MVEMTVESVRINLATGQRVVILKDMDGSHYLPILIGPFEATAIALAVVSIAGVLLGIRTIFDPTIGPARLLYAFEVVIIGGLGSLWGTLVGGVILGVAQAIGAAFDPSWDTLAGHLVFLAVLLFRPRGLIPKTFDL